jgi:hypothetical protein
MPVTPDFAVVNCEPTIGADTAILLPYLFSLCSHLLLLLNYTGWDRHYQEPRQRFFIQTFGGFFVGFVT